MTSLVTIPCHPICLLRGRLSVYRRVYRAVRTAEHNRRRAIRCCRDIQRGSWAARDGGEMRAQVELLGDAMRRSRP